MNGHPEFLELVAASIDFDLSDEEFGRLSTHLARCPECRRAADELRGDATAIAAYPPPRLAPARAEQILRAALRTPRSQPRWGLLAVAAMLTTLGGGILFAGFQLINDDDPTPSEPPPSVVAEASVPPSAAPEDTAEPGAPDGGNPPAVDVPEPSPSGNGEMGEINFEFPRTYSDQIDSVRVAPLADGRLWVTFRDGNGTVLALLDDAGAGEPAAIPGAEDCVPLAAADGSVRLACVYSDGSECSDGGCYTDRVYAFTPDFDEQPGFPVSFPNAINASADRHHARLVGTSVVMGYMEFPDDGEGETTSRLITVKDDGSVTEGFPLDGLETCCTISPAGIGFGRDVESHDDGSQTTTIFGFDSSGMIANLAVPVAGTASGPAFGPDGEVYVTSWIDGGSEILRIDDGTPVRSVNIPESVTWDPTIDGPLAPLVDDRGRTWIVADGAILAYDGSTALNGFPYEPATALLERGNDCGPQDTGCQGWTAPPVMAPRALVYALEEGPRGRGDRITVVNPDGSVRSGWPVTLQRAGATWDSVTIGEDRTAYAVAIEPEPGNKASISILAFAPNGTREWIRTLVEP